MCCLFCAVVFPATVFANSSWGWIAETRPYDVLPYVIVITLAIETWAINKIPKIGKPFKVFCIVTIANLLSFAAPYLFWYSAAVSDQLYTFSETLENMPVYIVGIAYLFITLALKFRLYTMLLYKVYKIKSCCLGPLSELMYITTIMLLFIERIICPDRGRFNRFNFFL
jgi:hypothetical protein